MEGNACSRLSNVGYLGYIFFCVERGPVDYDIALMRFGCLGGAIWFEGKGKSEQRPRAPQCVNSCEAAVELDKLVNLTNFVTENDLLLIDFKKTLGLLHGQQIEYAAVRQILCSI